MLNQFFKCFDVQQECFFTGFGRFVARVWFFSDELFFDDDVIFGFERFGMAGEIAVGRAEQFLERTKVSRFVYRKHRHDAQTNPVIERFIDILDNVLQMVNDEL